MTGAAQLDLCGLASALVQRQRELINLLSVRFDVPVDASLLARVPPYGTLDAENTIWGFAVHGYGIRFIDVRSLECVDMERHPETPDMFGKWRLINFARSRGQDIDETIDLDSAEGFRVATPGFYRVDTRQ